jgi:fructose/tagatose bisphosphate aldolase
LRIAHRTALEGELRDHPDEYAMVKLVGPLIDAVRDTVEQKIQAFGSARLAAIPSA